jgi:colanic acid/amylovoran biosynthesis glycosyltransferase
MTVVMVVPYFPKLSESFLVDKLVGLLRKGWDVHVACEMTNEHEWKSFESVPERTQLRACVHTEWISTPRIVPVLLMPFCLIRCFMANPVGTVRYLSMGIRRFRSDVFRRLYLDANIIILKPDILHFEFGAQARGRMHLKQILNCRIVVSFRGYDLNYHGLENSDHYDEVWQRADVLHLLGEDLWQRAQQRGCPPDENHVLIPPAVDPAFYHPNGRVYESHIGTADRPLRILSVGRLSWVKGYEYAMHAIRLLVDQGIASEYRIVGDGDYLEPLSFCRYQLGLESAVELLGSMDRNAVRTQMLRADVFLHAAVSEGFCNVVIEAQSVGLPVVCTDAGGLPENVRDGETGFVVPRRRPAALAEKLALLGADSELRHRMGVAGRHRTLTHFQSDRQISAFDQLYRSLSGDHQ